MGVVSLGAGLFGYFGPQMLGILRDLTGSFAAGFYMVAIADVITLTLIAVALPDDARSDTHMNRQFVTCVMARLIALSLTALGPGAGSARAPATSAGSMSLRRPGQQMPYRVYVPKTWDGKASLPIILMLHGAGANEGTLPGSGRWPADEARRAARLHRRLAARVHAARAPTAIRFGCRRSSARPPRPRRSGLPSRRRVSASSI